MLRKTICFRAKYVGCFILSNKGEISFLKRAELRLESYDLFMLVYSVLSRNFVCGFQGRSEVKYASLGKILHSQEFYLVSLEMSTRLPAIALSISELILNILR